MRTALCLLFTLLVIPACGGSFSAAGDTVSRDDDGGTVVQTDASPEAEAPDARQPADAGVRAEAGDAKTASDAGPDAALDAAPDVASDAVSDAALDGVVDAGVDGHDSCSPIVYYLDGDTDGWGGTTTTTACDPPDAGTWVTKGGDCDDSNPIVNPGQAAYFSQGYVPTGKVALSFDYDCDGQETESGSPVKADCQVVNLSCTGSGYVEADPVRSGAGVDAFCGSDSRVSCSFMNLVCASGPRQQAAPIACH